VKDYSLIPVRIFYNIEHWRPIRSAIPESPFSPPRFLPRCSQVASPAPRWRRSWAKGISTSSGSASFMPLYAERDMPFWTQTLAEVFSVTSNW